MNTVRIDYTPRYTYSDYEQWEGHWELIQGVPHAMSPLPTIEHQRVSGNINVELTRALQHCASCIALLPVDWKIDNRTVVQPDNSVVCGEVSGKYLSQAPVLIFEILSPSTMYKDRNIKSLIYAAEGVKYYVIVDSVAQMAEVYQLRDGAYERLLDARDSEFEFDFGPCLVLFNFGKIWPV